MVARLSRLAALTLAAVLLAGAAPAWARGGDDGGHGDARVRGTCGRGASSELRLSSHDGTIRVEFEVKRRGRSTWRVTLVHERRVAWRGTVHARDSFRVRRSVGDFDGPDQVTVRASGPRGVVCTGSATLSG
jgi:hypothetical protein